MPVAAYSTICPEAVLGKRSEGTTEATQTSWRQACFTAGLGKRALGAPRDSLALQLHHHPKVLDCRHRTSANCTCPASLTMAFTGTEQTSGDLGHKAASAHQITTRKPYTNTGFIGRNYGSKPSNPRTPSTTRCSSKK